MKNSLEVRAPFLNHKLFEQVLRFQFKEKMIDNNLKCILKIS